MIPDGTPKGGICTRVYTPSDRRAGASRICGSTWRASARRSTGSTRNCTVVAGPAGSDWLEAGRDVSQKLGLPLGLQQLPNGPSGRGIQMGLRGAVLVRPDGHVAWRMPYIPADPARELAGAIGTLLH